MNLLSKIWSIIKSIFAAFTKEPENNVLDVGIPADPNGADDASTDTVSPEPEVVPTEPVADATVPVDPSAPAVQDPNQSN